MATIALALARAGLIPRESAERRFAEREKRRILLRRLSYRADVLATHGNYVRLESVEKRIRKLKGGV